MQKGPLYGSCVAIYQKIPDVGQPFHDFLCENFDREHDNLDYEGVWDSKDAV